MKKLFIIFFGMLLLIPQGFCVFPEVSSYANTAQGIYGDTDQSQKDVDRYGDFFLSTDASSSSTIYAAATSRIKLYDNQYGWYLTQTNTTNDTYPDIYGLWYEDKEVDKCEVYTSVWAEYHNGDNWASANAKLMW